MKKSFLFLSFLLGLFFFGLLFFLREAFFSAQFYKAYENKNFTGALEMLEKKYLIGPSELHNLGNVSYHLWQQSPEKKRAWGERAEAYYSGSLDLRFHPDTKEHYDYVKKLLEEQEEAQNQVSSQQSQKTPKPEENQNTSSGSTSSGNTQSSESQTPETQDMSYTSNAPIQNARGEEYKLSDEDALSELTDEEKQALEAYIETLKEEQAENQGLFGKQVPEKTDFEKRFESLFGGSQEKDW